MGKVVRKLFGGTDKGLRRTIQENTDDAREFALQLFPSGEANRNLGTQQALNILGGVIPQQLSTFRAGNVAAQDAAIRGLSMANDAILGNPLGGQTLSPVSLGVDTGFARQELPEFTNIADSLQQRDAGTAAMLAGINSDADLFLAAAEGDIEGFSKKDRKFFRNLVNANSELFAGSTRFIDNPVGSVASLMGTDDPEFEDLKKDELPPGVLTPTNVRRVSTLLNRFAGL